MFKPAKDKKTGRRIADLESGLAVLRSDFEWLRSHSDLASKRDLQLTEGRIMEQIKQYAERVETIFADLGTSVDNLTSDVAALKQAVIDIQNSPGTLSPEDQASLDIAEAKARSLADRLKALDEATAPAEVPVPE